MNEEAQGRVDQAQFLREMDVLFQEAGSPTSFYYLMKKRASTLAISVENDPNKDGVRDGLGDASNNVSAEGDSQDI